MVQAANVAQLPLMRRRTRRPSHTWHLRHRPYVVQPCAFAPVLAGETLKNLLFQCRAVADPIRNPLIGWWLEHYWFYTSLESVGQEDFLWDPTLVGGFNATKTSTALELYQVGSSATDAAEGPQEDFLGVVYNRIVDEYFRNENETNAQYRDGRLCLAQITGNNVFDSWDPATKWTSADVALTVGVDDQISASELERLRIQYDMMRDKTMTPMSYEDYLRSQGVNVPMSQQAKYDKPELIRFTREWTYPVNTVNPADGTPSSTVSWAVAERADKDRYFKQPGFIMGVTVARPKVYLKNQKGTLSGYLNTAYKWLPRQVMANVDAALHKFTIANNLLPNTEDYILDFRDLFEFGEQFLNFDPATLASSYGFNQMATSDKFGTGRYPATADINELFVTVSRNNIRQDGVVDLQIATQLPKDPTPGNDAMNNA